MKELDELIYYRKILQLQPDLLDKMQGKLTSVNAICKFLDKTKVRDSSLIEFVKNLIMVDVFKEKDDGFYIDENSKIIVREMLEMTESYKVLDSLYDIFRNKKKGTDL